MAPPGRILPSRPHAYRYRSYRPAWSLGFYSGYPYDYYGYPYSAYGYGRYGYSPYGYGLPPAGWVGVAPGTVYGGVRIQGAPRDAQVFADGYYAGVVDDFDGVFQHLSLEAGPHQIEIRTPGYPPLVVDVRVEPGRTITYHAR